MIRRLLHRLLLRPLMWWFANPTVRHPERLPHHGPAIVFANHNSHADTALLMAALPTELIGIVRPLAAADYWFSGPFRRWFSQNIVAAVAIDRSGATEDPLAAAIAALDAGNILIVFPEGTRGEPGRLGRFHSGVARLAASHPGVPVIPVWLDGCSGILPRHGRLPHRSQCTVTVGQPVQVGGGDPRRIAAQLREHLAALA